MPSSHTRFLLDDLLQIKDQLKADAGKPYETLQQRDRRIGIELSHLKSTPVKQIRAWLDKILDDSGNRHTAPLGNTIVAMSRLLIIAGFITGISTALALFYYTGAQPINVINVLAVGVALQLLLLVVFILAVTSHSAWLTNILSSLNAGRWAARLAYFMPSLRKPLDKIMGAGQYVIDEQIIKWQSVLWSQQFAVAFNIALCLCCIYLVTFSDLAFGWSTTLAFDNAIVKRITDVLSYPWKSIFPQAVPQMEMIDATRFYRLKTITLGNQQSGVLNQAQLAGNWWRFLLLCLIVYGLIPRILTCLIAKTKLQRSIKQSILSLPGLHLLLDRMNTPQIATNAEKPETTADLNQVHTIMQVTSLTDRDSYLVHWGQPAVDSNDISNWLNKSTGVNIIGMTTVASNNNEDFSDLNTLPALKNRQALAVMVKAWEPPTLELTDWLTELRTHYGKQTLIALIPYDLSIDSRLTAVSEPDSQTWQDFLRRQHCEHIEFHGVRQ